MSSAIDRCPGRRFRAGVLPVVLAALTGLVLGARSARAVPIDEPHVGGIGFSGPTTGDLAAIYWNPAALGLMHGLHITFSGTGRLSNTRVARGPSAGGTAPEVVASDKQHPFVWPPGPGAFAGISYDVGGDRLALAGAVYMPFLDRSSYQSSSTNPIDTLSTRYHRISADLRNLALGPAVAVRLAGDFRLGFAPTVLLSTGRLSFAESTCSSGAPCEDPAADARIDAGSNQGIFSSKAAVTLNTGLYFRRRNWEYGLAFSTRPLGGAVGSSAVILGDQTRVLRAPRDVTAGGPAAVVCDNMRDDGRGCVFADIIYKLPWMLTGAVTWHPRPGWEVTALERILSFPADDVIDIRLTGRNLAQAGVPAHIVLYRGFGTVFDTRVRVSNWVTERVRVGAGLRFESSSLPERAVSPAAVDNRKFEPTAMIEVHAGRHVWFNAGYGFTYMLPVTVSSPASDPQAASACAAPGGDLAAAPCARATADGNYRHFEHDFSLSLNTQFW
ncbi:MAG: hypothetical protein ABIS92_10005 [Polyangia bacterium]